MGRSQAQRVGKHVGANRLNRLHANRHSKCQNVKKKKADFSSCISRLIRLAHRTNVSPVLLCMAPPSVTIGFLPFSIFLKWHDQLLGSAKIIKQSTSDSSFSAGPNHAVAREGLAFFFQHDSSSVSCRSTPQVTSAHLGGGLRR